MAETSNMKEVCIKISSDTYDVIVKNYDGRFGIPCVNIQDLYKAIAHGTVLPENHDRIGDLGKLETEIANGIKAGNLEEGYEKYPNINNVDDCLECVQCADTLIEASKKGV